MRQIEIRMAERQLAIKQIPPDEHQTPDIEIHVDGRLLQIYKPPPVAYPTEPKQIGAQVRGFAYGRHGEYVFTKIAPNQWSYATSRVDAKIAPWREIAVSAIIGAPEPPEPVFPEPDGIGAIIKTDCHLGECSDNGIDESHFVKIGRDEWICSVCKAQYNWPELTGDAPKVELVRAGIKP